MSEASLTAAPTAEVQPKPPANSIFRHARYVVAENPVTGLSFGLFIIIALCALIGPYIAPYDPLASDTSATLQSPSLHHWFGTDLLGRDIFSRVLVATRLDFVIAVASVALVLVMGGLAGVAQLQPSAVLFNIAEDSLPAVSAKLATGAKLPVIAWDRELKRKLGK